MLEPILSLRDAFVTPAFFLITILFTYCYKELKYKNSPIKKFMLPALYLRLFGIIMSGLIYEFYFVGGDTTHYFNAAIQVYDITIKDPVVGIKLMSNSAVDEITKSNYKLKYSELFTDTSEGLIMRLSSLICLFSFRSYYGISLFFSFFAFVGNWKIYKTFTYMYPHLYKPLAYAILFAPSVFFWGTGLLKDPLALGLLGFLFHSFYQLFFLKKHFLKNTLIIIFSLSFLATIKIYIPLAFIPAIIIWIFLEQKNKIRIKKIKILLIPFLLVIAIILGSLSISYLGSSSKKYNLDSILETLVITQGWISYTSKVQGSVGVYDLGKLEPTLSSLLTYFPKAVNVTLFRPYLWETRSLAQIPAMLESSLTFLLTIFILLKIGILRVLKLIIEKPELLFCLLFTMTFAFAVGIASGNFGSLVRYKIPCLPFYYSFLVILYYNKKNKTAVVRF